jgi:hypothetical protein
MKKQFGNVCVIALVSVLAACDMSYLVPEKGKPGEMPAPYVPSSDAHFTSFFAERDETYYLIPEGTADFSGYSNPLGVWAYIDVNDFPLSTFFYQTTAEVAMHVSMSSYSGVGQEIVSLTINKNEYTYFLPDNMYSDTLSLPKTTPYSLAYSPSASFTGSLIRIATGVSLYTNGTYTFHTVSRNFYRYKKLTIVYPDPIEITNVLPYELVDSYTVTGRTLEIILKNYDEPFSGYVCLLFLKAEDGTTQRKYITIE